MPQVGETVWYRGPNSSFGYYWQGVILGETSRSWLIGTGHEWWAKDPGTVARFASKYPKKGTEFVSRELGELSCWAMNNRYSIAKAVESCTDPQLLRKVADLVGYNG